MQVLDVRIQRVGDPPVFADFHPQPSFQVQPGPIAILENGTENGQIAILFIMPLPDETTHYFQLTEGSLRQLAGIVAGLRKRIDGGN